MRRVIRQMEAARRLESKLKAPLRRPQFTLHNDHGDGKPINGWRFGNINAAIAAADTYLMERFGAEASVGVYIQGTDGTVEFYGRN